MFTTIDNYLNALKEAMKDADPALVQDAQSDAREHLSTALEVAREADPALNETDALQKLIDEYGSPEETASAYKEVERRTSPALKPANKTDSIWGRIFGVYVDPRTWGSLLFTFIAFVTGIIYFTWAVTGLSLSISLLILIIGVPFAFLFLLSLQGIALLEGRLVEALLGVRMPRRSIFARPGLNWLERLKALVTDKHTWLSLLYMVLQMPLGIVYFTLNTTLLSTALALISTPFLPMLVRNYHVQVDFGGASLPTGWALILFPIGGFILLTLTMHLVRAFGWLHGRYAKWMLVSE